MWQPIKNLLELGISTVALVSISATSTLAQYGTYPGTYGSYPTYGASQGGWSGSIGGDYSSSYQGGPGYGGYGVSQGPAPVGYGPGWASRPRIGGPGYPSPAQRQGFREGEIYWETGIAPQRPLSPAETRGFIAGERRAASTPWQLDPVRQQGYREGQLYWETGQIANRPLTPAEAQGFRAGENRAAAGYGYPY